MSPTSRRGSSEHDAATPSCPDALPSSFATLADDLKAVWTAPTTDVRLKKRIVRTVDPRGGRRYRLGRQRDRADRPLGGAASTPNGASRSGRRGKRNSTAPDIIDAVRLLVRIAGDDLIAGLLNRNRLVTGNGNRWTRERVTSMRSHHRIPVYRRAADGIEPGLNLTRAATLLGVAPKTLRRAAENGEIDAVHPLADGPWIFSRSVLEGEAGRTLAVRAGSQLRHPTGPHPDQQNLFSSMA